MEEAGEEAVEEALEAGVEVEVGVGVEVEKVEGEVEVGVARGRAVAPGRLSRTQTREPLSRRRRYDRPAPALACTLRRSRRSL